MTCRASTASCPAPRLQTLVQDEQLPFLPKPFTPGELSAEVDELRLATTGVGTGP